MLNDSETREEVLLVLAKQTGTAEPLDDDGAGLMLRPAKRSDSG